MVITFAGHGNTFIDTELSARIKDSIMTLVKNEKFVSFYCGGYGNFDEGCAAICRELRPKISPCEIVLVTPYLTIMIIVCRKGKILFAAVKQLNKSL